MSKNLLTIEIIDTENAAFEGNYQEEVARIVDTVSEKIRNGHYCGVLHDINGNRVGTWELLEK